MALLCVAPANALVDIPAVHMSHAVVGDRHKRRGAGRALVCAAAAYAEQRGIEQLVVSVHPGSRDANRFFARLGSPPLAVRRTAPVAAVRRRLGQAETRPVADHVVRRPRTAPPRRATRLSTTMPLGPRDVDPATYGPVETAASLDSRAWRLRRRTTSPPARGCCCSTATRWPTAPSSRLPVENFSTTTGSRPTRSTASPPCSSTSCATSRPTHVAVTFDVSRSTFRTETYADYKAGRAETPTDFKGQVSLVREVLDALRVPIVTAEGFEADDVIATLATQAAAEDMDVLIVTGDRDAFQLVSDRVTVLYNARGVSTCGG
jgi:predicted GNAT family acetyltransferase